MPTITVSLPSYVTELQAEPVPASATDELAQTVSLTAGAGSIVVAATDADWCWKFTEHGAGYAATRFCAVSGNAAYSALVDLDPGTLVASVEPADSAWEAIANAATAAASAAAPKTATVYMTSPSGADDTATAQALMDTVPSGGCLVVGNRFRVDGPLNITTPMTLHFTARGEFYSGAGTSTKTMINVTSSDVHLTGEGKITGPQFAAAADQTCVKFLGTSGSAPLADVSVKGLTVTNSGKNGILAQYVDGFAFDDNVVRDCCYAGIGVSSAINGSIDGNVVQNITQTGYSNSYGIYTTRAEVDLTANDPRSENISICNNRVQDIPGWDGINTHGGKAHTISDNVLINVGKPIELVAAQESGGLETLAPLDMTVTGNVITSTVSNGTRAAGIMLVGADYGGVGSPAEYATGTISGNVVRGHGDEDSSINAAILLYYTKGATVTGNTIIEPSPTGIGFYHTNVGFVCQGNTIIDPWTSGGATCAAVNAVSSYNTGHIAGNNLQLNGKSATLVAHRGISIADFATSSITLGQNDMTAAATPLRDTGRRGVSVTGNPGLWAPVDNLLIACDGDPMTASSTLLLPTAGVVYVRKVKMAETKVITNVVSIVTNAGATLANAYFAVFDSTGAQLGVSADQSTALQSTGTKTVALSAPTTVQPAGTWVYEALVIGSAGTMPTFAAWASGRISLNLTSSNLRWGSVGSGLSAMPSSITPGSIASVTSAVPLWALS